MGTRTKTNQGRDALTKLFLAEDLGNGIRLNPLEVRQVNAIMRSAAVQKVQELQDQVAALQELIDSAQAEAAITDEAGEEE